MIMYHKLGSMAAVRRDESVHTVQFHRSINAFLTAEFYDRSTSQQLQARCCVMDMFAFFMLYHFLVCSDDGQVDKAEEEEEEEEEEEDTLTEQELKTKIYMRQQACQSGNSSERQKPVNNSTAPIFFAFPRR